MSKKKIERLLAALVRAEEAVVTELRHLYPEDSFVRIKLSANQVHPSEAQVFGYGGGRSGRVRVKLFRSPKQMVRDVSYEDIQKAGE